VAALSLALLPSRRLDEGVLMVRLIVDFDDEAKVWYVKTSDLSGVHAEGETLEQLCGKLPAIVSDLVESNQDRKPGTCYCSFCGKSQHQVPKLIAGPAVFICNECVDLCSEIVEEKRDNPDPTREIKLEQLKQLRADVARLHEGLTRIEERINGMMGET
jgi:ClpX C4-type zinc finger/Domain of unknown function (DUF1902)